MLFNTPAFGFFFVLVCTAYWVLGQLGWRAVRLWLLLLASYYFYAGWDYRFLALIGVVTVIDYGAGRALGRARSPRLRLYIVAVTVGFNLGLLGLWKYTDFFLDSLAPAYLALGAEPPPLLHVILPVGISFFTFQGLSYVIDVYRDEVPVERSLYRFALYIAFFPQLVAGPIVRAKDLLFQLDRPLELTSADFGRGLLFILRGLLKKIVLADFLAANIVDRVFDLPSHYSSAEVLAAIYGYSLQIYGDFSGYTDIAIGAALLLGFKLPDNFNLPYRADGLRDFWRRWHISLSSWLRDYLYISLGGSRGSSYRTCRNLMLTMLLGGLWHGASYTFVIWGGMHGLGLVAGRLLAPARRAPGRAAAPHQSLWLSLPHPLRVLLTFHFVTLLWLFFRAESFSAAIAMLSQLCALVPGTANLRWEVVAVLALGFALHYAPRGWYRWLEGEFTRAPAALQAAATIAVVYVAGALSQSGPAPFIYFQF